MKMNSFSSKDVSYGIVTGHPLDVWYLQSNSSDVLSQ